LDKQNELTIAKINAALRILEWAKDDIEPGIGDNPRETHLALAEAFVRVFRTIDAVVDSRASSSEAPAAVGRPIGTAEA